MEGLDRRGLLWLGVSAFVGLLIGLVIGWVIWPVEWVNATPTDLDSSYQEDYVALVADSYALTSDLEAARLRLQGWPPDDLSKLMGQLVARYQTEGKTLEARRVYDLAAALGVPVEPISGPAPAPEPSSELGSILLQALKVCGIFIAVILILGGIALGVSSWRRQQVLRAARDREPLEPTVEEDSLEVPQVEDTQRTFVTTYTLGDDAYDESFSIESASGEFLGECGVSIAEVIGTGDPDKVCAMEVWLFDRNDIRTVTKVLTSDHAFHDESIRARQSTKGEVILAAPDQEINLETASLRVSAKVLELDYGSDDLPADSFFSKLTLQLASSVKESEEG